MQDVSTRFTYDTDKSRRAKSQDRSQIMRGYGAPPMSTPSGGMASNNNGGGGGAAGYNMNQYYGGGPVQPNLLEARLLQHQQSRMNNNMSMMAAGAGGPPSSKPINMSLPVAPLDYDLTEFTTAVYKFPQEKEDMPYRVKIPGQLVTLCHVKEFMPKKGGFRYYFKTEIDGEVCFEEETDERAKVPMFQGKIIVQCRVLND